MIPADAPLCSHCDLACGQAAIGDEWRRWHLHQTSGLCRIGVTAPVHASSPSFAVTVVRRLYRLQSETSKEEGTSISPLDSFASQEEAMLQEALLASISQQEADCQACPLPLQASGDSPDQMRHLLHPRQLTLQSNVNRSRHDKRIVKWMDFKELNCNYQSNVV